MKKGIIIGVVIIIIVAVGVFFAGRSDLDTDGTTASEQSGDYLSSDTLGEDMTADDENAIDEEASADSESVTNTNQTNPMSKDAITLKILDSGKFPYYFAKVYIGTGFGMNVTLNGTSIMKWDSSNSRRRSNSSPEVAQTLLKSGTNEIVVDITDVVDTSSSYYKPSLGVYIVGNDKNALPEMFPANPNDPQPHIIASIRLEEGDIKPGKTTYVFDMER